MPSVDDVVGELAGDKVLSVVDRLAIEAFAVLVVDMRQAQEVMSQGLVADGDAEHPAVNVIVKCSRELRGWVERRPDLFGSAASSAGAKSGRAKFTGGLKAVP